MQGEAASADVEAAASYSEDMAEMLMKVATLNNSFQCRRNRLLLEEGVV